MNFLVTESAVDRIKYLINQDGKNVALRISVNGGGCSGFMYQYDFIDRVKDDDFILSLNEVKIVFDTISQQFLENCTLDFVKELGNSYFQINNPGATAKCGCGNSFSYEI